MRRYRYKKSFIALLLSVPLLLIMLFSMNNWSAKTLVRHIEYNPSFQPLNSESLLYFSMLVAFAFAILIVAYKLFLALRIKFGALRPHHFLALAAVAAIIAAAYVTTFYKSTSRVSSLPRCFVMGAGGHAGSGGTGPAASPGSVGPGGFGS